MKTLENLIRAWVKCTECDGFGHLTLTQTLSRGPGDWCQFPPTREVKIICDRCYGVGELSYDLEDWETPEDYNPTRIEVI